MTFCVAPTARLRSQRRWEDDIAESGSVQERADQVLNGLLGKIFSVLSSGDPAQPRINAAREAVGEAAGGRAAAAPSERVFISYASPGIAVCADDLSFLETDVGEEPQKEAAFSYLVNSIPTTPGFWSQGGAMLWGPYEEALSNVSVAQTRLSATEERELAAARTELVDESTGFPMPSKLQQAYNYYRLEYRSAVDAYNAVRLDRSAKFTFATRGARLHEDVRRARSNWESYGQKGHVEQLEASIAQLSSRGYAQKLLHARSVFEMARLEEQHFGLYYPTYFSRQARSRATAGRPSRITTRRLASSLASRRAESMPA